MQKENTLTSSLVGTAYSDLDSCFILAENNIYHNALFFLQQSIEKLVKAIGIEYNIINANQLKRISHRPTRIFQRINSFAIDQIREIEEHKFRDEKKEAINNYLEYKTSLEHGVEFLNSLQNSELRELTLIEIADALTSAENIKLALDSKHWNSDDLVTNYYSILDTDFGLTISEEEKILEYNTIKVLLNCEIELNLINRILMLLSILTQAHQDPTRYPCNTCAYSPMDTYQKTHPIIHYMPNIHNLQLVCLEKFEEIRRSIAGFNNSQEEEEEEEEE